jgi:hypothetical protein
MDGQTTGRKLGLRREAERQAAFARAKDFRNEMSHRAHEGGVAVPHPHLATAVHVVKHFPSVNAISCFNIYSHQSIHQK